MEKGKRESLEKKVDYSLYNILKIWLLKIKVNIPRQVILMEHVAIWLLFLKENVQLSWILMNHNTMERKKNFSSYSICIQREISRSFFLYRFRKKTLKCTSLLNVIKFNMRHQWINGFNFNQIMIIYT